MIRSHWNPGLDARYSISNADQNGKENRVMEPAKIRELK
jgi:hypothetical protein